MSTISNGMRADEARARIEDKNTLDAKNKIYVGTGVAAVVNGHSVYQTEGKNIIQAINDAGTVANATNASYATSAQTARTAQAADVATDATNVTGTLKGKSIQGSDASTAVFDENWNAFSARTAQVAKNATEATTATYAAGYTEDGAIKLKFDEIDGELSKYYGIRSNEWPIEGSVTIPVGESFAEYATSGLGNIKGITLFFTADDQQQVLKLPMIEYLLIKSGEFQEINVTYAISLTHSATGVMDCYEGKWSSSDSRHLKLSYNAIKIK